MTYVSENFWHDAVNKATTDLFTFGYKHIIKPHFIFNQTPDVAHSQMIDFCKVTRNIPPLMWLCREMLDYTDPILETNVMGVDFANPFGLSAGLDKDCEMPVLLDNVGFGFETVGSTTSRREAVFEHDHVVVGVRHFAVLVRIARLARGQRIAFGRRARTGGDRTVHTCGRHRNPIAGQRVAAHFRSRVRHFLAGRVELVGETVRKLARILQFASLDAGDVFRIVVKIEEITSVRERGRRDTDMLLRIFSRSVVDEITHVIIHLPEPARPGVPERAL